MPERAKRTAVWTKVAFGDVVRQVKDRVDPEQSGLERYVAGEHMDTDDLRLRRWGEIGDGYLGPAFHMRFKPGHVLYGSRRTYLRKVAIADFEGITANTTYVLEPKDPNVLLPALLPFIMQTEAFNKHSVRESKGSVNPYVNFSDLAWYEFALPPIEEQRRVAAMLNAGRQVLDATHGLLCAAERVALAHAAAVAQRLAAELPARPLGDVADVRYGLTVNPLRSQSPRRAPYLRVANVARGTLNLAEVKEIGLLSGDEDYELQSGDVLIVEGHADVAEIGRAAVWRDEIAGAMHQNHLIRVRCGDSLKAEYLCALINSSHGRSYFRSRAKSSSGLNTINSTVVKQYAIPLPPEDVQTGLVSEFHMLSVTRSYIEARQAAAKRLMTVALRFDAGGDQ